QTGNPYQFRCEASFLSPVARQVEHWIHRANAARMVHLEWLRLTRAQIPDLVVAAKREGDCVARMSDGMLRWSYSESNGKERQPSGEETRLHELAHGVLTELCPLRLRLEYVTKRIHLAAGRVLRIPGVVRVWPFPSSTRFSSALALEKFPHLAAAHSVDEVGGRFRWRKVPTLGSAKWADLRSTVESVKKQWRDLNAAMLEDINGLEKEGQRTNTLVSLHEEYLVLKQQETRLKLDEQDLKAQAIQALEDCESFAGLWSFRRSRSRTLNRNAFGDAHPVEAVQCHVGRAAEIRRRIYPSRSY